MAGIQRFGLAISGTSVGAGAATLEIIAPTSRGFTLRSIQWQGLAAAASLFAASRAAARGITPGGLTSLTMLAADTYPARTSLTQVATSWATPPTLGPVLTFFNGNTVGATTTWVPSTGVIIMPGQSLAIHASIASAAGPLFLIELDELVD